MNAGLGEAEECESLHVGKGSQVSEELFFSLSSFE